MNSAVQKSAKPEIAFNDPQYLFNRELSWLEFNRRVLEEALDETNPLLERLKFLAIFSTNLDEFFMIRVSGLKEQVAEGISKKSLDGMTPAEQLQQIRNRVLPMLADQMRCLHREILPALAEAGIKICPYKDLEKNERAKLNEHFADNIYPVITPQAVDISHPFPYVSNLSLNLGILVAPDYSFDHGNLKHLYNQERFVRLKLPPNVPRLTAVNDDNSKFTLLGEIVSANIKKIFPNMSPHKAHLFRVTRDADIELREDEAGDLLRSIENELFQQRRFSFPVRLEVSATMPSRIVNYLTSAVGLKESDVYRIEGMLNVPDLMQIYALDRPDLKDKPIAYSIPKAFHQRQDIFDSLKKNDVLVHHPFTAYNSVTDFIDAAAEDEEVRAIKICLYRTGKNSPIVKSLIKASRKGKQVAALVELKARFDEENNIEWARRLEAEGVHVIYGMRGLKTHSKITLIVRNESGKLRRYVHIATGNYNPTTSKIYTDLGLFTSDKEIGRDVTDLFNFLMGYSFQTEYESLLVAPINLRERMLEMIDREAENKRSGKDARMIIKINSLHDEEIVHALYRASQAGVEIDLIVRGICILRPGIKGVSENIRVVSVVGRFLEHSRIFYFANAGEEEIYIGSADWMRRNLDRRVEAIVPIKDKKLLRYLKDDVLATYLRDTVNTTELLEDGSYRRLTGKKDEPPFNSQSFFVGQEI